MPTKAEIEEKFSRTARRLLAARPTLFDCIAEFKSVRFLHFH